MTESLSERMKALAWELKAHWGGYSVTDKAVDMLVIGADRLTEYEDALREIAKGESPFTPAAIAITALSGNPPEEVVDRQWLNALP